MNLKRIALYNQFQDVPVYVSPQEYQRYHCRGR